MYISQKQLLKSSTRSDRWLSKLDSKKEKSKYHVKDHAPVRNLRPTIPTPCHKSNNWWNCFSFTSVGLPLYVKFPLGDRRLFPLFGWTDKRKPVCSVGNTDAVDFWRKQDVAGHVIHLNAIFNMKLGYFLVNYLSWDIFKIIYIRPPPSDFWETRKEPGLNLLEDEMAT